MLWNRIAPRILALIVSLFCASIVVAQTQSTTQTSTTGSSQTSNQKIPTVQESVEVTATRIPEDPEEVPAAIEVFSGEELRARGARDLRSALSSAIGVEIAPGGDAGPASSVPEFWGLKEFDAFLLVVDGVPWGGAYNPALTSLSLYDVERIEVMRGPAPVTYGATSFVGVIQVIHHGVDSADRNVELHGGSFESGGGSFSSPVPLGGEWKSRLTVDAERLGFSDPREALRRGHGLWRVERKYSDTGRVWFNFDLNWLDQDPNSPRLREGDSLSPRVPVDANHNPQGSFLNDHRGAIMGGFERKVGSAQWTTMASVSHSNQDIFRGFLENPDAVVDNAHGVREKIHLTDIYIDSHLTWRLEHAVTFIAGGDYLHGRARANGADFDYQVPVDGSFAVTVPQPDELDVGIEDNRNFFGPYAMVEWKPLERLRIDAGLRLNVTHESRHDTDPGAGRDDSDDQTNTHIGANVGAIYTAWQQKQDSLGLYVNYRDTFKPAAIDFGIGEAFAGRQILEPETSQSVEGGLKARLFNHRAEFEASGFYMDFSNLVVPVQIGGLGGLINAGAERFAGFETGVELFLPKNVIARGNYSYHDAIFTNFAQDFGGVSTQLAGNRLEMSAHNLGAASIYYLPVKGFLAGVGMNYTGARFLNRRNTALADGFATVYASVGYRTPRWELRVDGTNLGDRRDPVSESELGDSQYYLMPSRRVDATLRFNF
jgi:outer membrane receptor protein involved in Fe transport